MLTYSHTHIHTYIYQVLVIGGVLTIISILPTCWIVGAYMIIVGLFVGFMELPFLFEKIQTTKNLAAKLKKISPSLRAVLYILYAIFFSLASSIYV